MTQTNQKQLNLDLDVDYWAVTDRANICLSPREVQPNVMKFDKLKDVSFNKEQQESKVNYKRYESPCSKP